MGVFCINNSKMPNTTRGLSLKPVLLMILYVVIKWYKSDRYFCAFSSKYKVRSKFCICHDGCAVVECAKIWDDMMIWTGDTANRFSIELDWQIRWQNKFQIMKATSDNAAHPYAYVVTLTDIRRRTSGDLWGFVEIVNQWFNSFSFVISHDTGRPIVWVVVMSSGFKRSI